MDEPPYQPPTHAAASSSPSPMLKRKRIEGACESSTSLHQQQDSELALPLPQENPATTAQQLLGEGSATPVEHLCVSPPPVRELGPAAADLESTRREERQLHDRSVASSTHAGPSNVALSNVDRGELGDVPAAIVVSDEESLPGADGVSLDGEATNTKAKELESELATAGTHDDQFNQADSATCPICMEPWTGSGAHRICCLACGHLFGRSCIKRWLTQIGKKNGKCPHCNRKAKVQDIRTLYVPVVTVIEGAGQASQEELGVLRAKNQELTAQNDRLNKEFYRLQGLLAALTPDGYRKLNSLQRGKNQGCGLFEDFRHLLQWLHSSDQSRSKEMLFDSGLPTKNIGVSNTSRKESFSRGDQRIGCSGFYNSAEVSGMYIDKRQLATEARLSHRNEQNSEVERSNLQKYFHLQVEMHLPGAKVLDMDAFSQMILVAQKSLSSFNTFCLNKISLLLLSEPEVIPLPPGTGAVRDICIAPSGGKLPGRLALVASLGKRISLFSLESNNVVLTYNLQSPSWSCAWDLNETNHIYAGLQDGSLSIFDLRQTSSPLCSVNGLSRHPVHTLHAVNECSLPQGLRRKGILSACLSGVCFWDMTVSGVQGCRPCSVPCIDNEGNCIALAYDHISNMAVSSFRPKPCQQQPQFSSFEQTGMCGPSSQMGSQTALHLQPFPAKHFPLVREALAPFPGESQHTNEGTESVDGQHVISPGLSDMNGLWTCEMPMVGRVSPVGMHRSAIVSGWKHESSLDFENLFAFGDEETKALWLWDVNTLSVVDCLKAHDSPILDVKSINIGGQPILGCTSMSKLQIYKS